MVKVMRSYSLTYRVIRRVKCGTFMRSFLFELRVASYEILVVCVCMWIQVMHVVLGGRGKNVLILAGSFGTSPLGFELFVTL